MSKPRKTSSVSSAALLRRVVLNNVPKGDVMNLSVPTLPWTSSVIIRNMVFRSPLLLLHVC